MSKPNAGNPRLTPAMQQFARFKERHPDCVLFFRMGDFYELFYDDAVLAHSVLGITLTQRTEGVPMAGVPYHAVEAYLRRMIDAGHRVAVCDQVQDPREATGVVDRAVTRVLTPGTLVDDTLLEEGRTNQVAAVHVTGPVASVAVIELSTGSFRIFDVKQENLLDEMVRLGPSEILYAETDDGGIPAEVEAVRTATGCAISPRPAWTFRRTDAHACLLEHFGVASLSGYGIAEDEHAVCAAGAVVRYLHETQSPEGGSGTRLRHLRPPVREASERYVTIDAASLRSLEIERTLRDQTPEGALLSIFSTCRTPMGKRLLRRWLCYPLRGSAAIEGRLRAVAALVEDRAFADRLRETLGHVQDVARITGRLAMGRATPRDLVALGRSIGARAETADLLAERPAFTPAAERLAAIADRVDPVATRIREQCTDEPPAHLREGGLFRDGVDATLDEARGLARDATTWLAGYQKSLKDDTGIGSLKVGFNKVFGYYIEVTHAHVEKIPPAFSRKQTLKNAERYITPELKTFEDRVTTAQAEAIEREKKLFDELCAQAAAESETLGIYADVVAGLDVLACFADTARRNGYVRPKLVEEPVLDIRQGRHPVLDRMLGERFVPNDCSLGGPSTLALITGPNMAGKSTFIRQVALIALLAQAGSFVPAERAVLGLVDRIFTRIGAADELHAGRSTFMVEMTEAANIVHNATERSLVILDEIGRGTSTLDGLSLAWAIAETLAARGCRTLFATHYHELTTLADTLPGVGNLHVTVREWGDDIIFLYRIVRGRTDRSYGIHVAKIAGLPPATIERASQLLETLAVQTQTRDKNQTPQPAASQLDLFTEYIEHPAVETLRSIELDGLTPLAAFDALRRLKETIISDRTVHERRQP